MTVGEGRNPRSLETRLVKLESMTYRFQGRVRTWDTLSFEYILYNLVDKNILGD